MTRTVRDADLRPAHLERDEIMLSFLALGFLIGLRHALEPDHVAAVVSLSTRGGTLRDHARNGAWWGVGHALTLLVLAGACVVFGLVIPERTERLLEGAVGVMLVWLGVSVFARMRRIGLHVHGHVHADGTAHVHAHGHPRSARDEHEHEHERWHPRSSLRTVGIGAVHGLAGSAALVLLVGSTAQSPTLGMAYIGLFGVGAIVGMMLLAATISLPLGFSARRMTRVYRWACAAVGVFSVVLGLRSIWAVVAPGAA